MLMIRLLAFALLCLIWGSTWLVIKIGYGGLGPFEVAALRFLLAGALLVPIGQAIRARDPAFRWPRGRAEWRLVAFVGVALFALDYGLIYWGEQHIDSSLTAVTFAVLPIFTAIAAHVYLPGERLTTRKLAGTLLAFLGVGVLFADRLRVDAGHLGPLLAIVASAACAAAASVATKRHGGALHPAALNAPAMLIGAAALAAASLAAGDGLSLPDSPGVWWSVIYLAVAGSIVTFLVYFWLLKTWSATSLSFISVFTPIVAIALGLLIRERPTPWMFAGAALILAGVATAVAAGRPRSRPAAPPR